ncbi:MAG: UDP-N-acetylmuramate dehydrogenase [Bacteroidota bacterium]
MLILENYSLKHLNTFGIETQAKYYTQIASENELLELIYSNKGALNNALILGGGSNILFTQNYEGLVIRYVAKGIKVILEDDISVLIKAEAGETWDDLVNYCVKNKYYGIENLSLIPGTVGAAPIQNIGAYGVELKDCFELLEGFFIDTGIKQTFTGIECNFGYRDSIFKRELKNKFVITSVVLRLYKKKIFNLSYGSLKEELKNYSDDELSIELVSECVKKIRRNKLPDPVLLGNSGSFFKNPEINENQFQLLRKKNPDLVFYKTSTGTYKIPAAWLIEKSGFKGKRIGDVGTFNKQALVIVNYGNANGREIKNYAEQIRNKVNNNFGILLDYEVNII